MKTKKASPIVNVAPPAPQVSSLEIIRNALPTDSLTRNALMLRGFEVLANLIDRKYDITHECGYPDVVTAQYCRELYDREGIAKRVVRIFPEECWKQDPEVLEDEDQNTDTAFERDWKSLQKRFNLFHTMQRADILSGIGTYGIILLGIGDGKALNEPVEGVPLSGKMPKKFVVKHKLNYIRVFDETSITINRFETNIKSPRYGQPELYNVNFIIYGGSNTQVIQPLAPTPTSPTPVHWTRIIHLADNLEQSEVYGVPRMQPVINRLIDLRKVLGGSGEMFWKGGFPGLAIEVDPSLQAVAELDKQKMREEFEAYQTGMQRFLALVGMKANSLAPQVADPTNHFVTHLKSIACSLGIPWRVFIGTEEAKLAADQDSSAWNERVSNRQTKYCTPKIITPLVNRLICYGIISPLKDMDAGVTVSWEDLHTPSDFDRAKIADTIADALMKYVSSGAQSVMPPKQFLTKCLNWSDEEADAALEEATLQMARVLDAANAGLPAPNGSQPNGGKKKPAGKPSAGQGPGGGVDAQGGSGKPTGPGGPAAAMSKWGNNPNGIAPMKKAPLHGPSKMNPSAKNGGKPPGPKGTEGNRKTQGTARAATRNRLSALLENYSDEQPRDDHGRFGSGGGGGGGAAVSKHSKMTISQAGASLKKLGFTLGKPAAWHPGASTMYSVKDSSGEVKLMSPHDIRQLIADKSAGKN